MRFGSPSFLSHPWKPQRLANRQDAFEAALAEGCVSVKVSCMGYETEACFAVWGRRDQGGEDNGKTGTLKRPVKKKKYVILEAL